MKMLFTLLVLSILYGLVGIFVPAFAVHIPDQILCCTNPPKDMPTHHALAILGLLVIVALYYFLMRWARRRQFLKNQEHKPTLAFQHEQCPDKEFMGEFACSDRAQCFEPCGLLGHDARFSVRAQRYRQQGAILPAGLFLLAAMFLFASGYIPFGIICLVLMFFCARDVG